MAGISGVLTYARRNKNLVVGLALLLSLFLFSAIGHLLVDVEKAYPLGAPSSKPPSSEFPFGTDPQGRELLAVAVRGTYLTLRIGFIAGGLGLLVGTILGFTAAYYGGLYDTVVKWVVDVLLTVPALLILVVIAATLTKGMSLDSMALVIALLAWMWPTRTIRAQVLTLRERAFVRVAKLSGATSLEIIFKELMPNLLPLLGAMLINSVIGAVFASIGLEALGLGALRQPTLGMTIYWTMQQSAFARGLWWWIITPIVIIIILFVGLFQLAIGLDELANPRLRRKV
jgi:peptide/nickel transport system permease protein